MSIVTAEKLPDNFTFLSPGERIRHDSFGLGLYPCEMNGKVGYYASLSEDEELAFDEGTDEATML